MPYKHCKQLFMAILLIMITPAVFAVEILKWERLPLAVPLVLGQERVIFLDKNVRVGMDASLKNKLRVQSTGGALYLLATDQITPSRLQVQVVDTGEIILIDIATIEGDNALEPVKIIDAKEMQLDLTNEEQLVHNQQVTESLKVPAPIALTRYAAQSLYAPLRTIEPIPGINRIPIKATESQLKTLLPTYPIEAKALVAWRLGDFYVTAIKLTNKGFTRIDLDPRQLQGNFYAATFQHTYLGEIKTAEDTTTLYLVTQGVGLEKSLFASTISVLNNDKEQSTKGK